MNKVETEQQIRQALRSLSTKNPPTAREIQETLDAQRHGRSAAMPRQRRSRGREHILVLAAAAVVGVMLVSMSFLFGQGGIGSDGQPSTSPSTTTGQESLPDLTSVGRGRAVVDVPAAWGRGQIRCGVATGNTVIFETSASRACKAGPSSFDSLTIGSAATHQAGPNDMKTTTEGSDVFTRESRRNGFTLIEKLVPAQDAWFLIRVRDPALAEGIASSLRILSPEQTTMPDIYQGATGGQPGYSAAPGPAEVERRLEQAGLAIEVRYVGSARRDHWSALEAEIQPGMVLPVGTTVTVTYSVGTKGP